MYESSKTKHLYIEKKQKKGSSVTDTDSGILAVADFSQVHPRDDPEASS